VIYSLKTSETISHIST